MKLEPHQTILLSRSIQAPMDSTDNQQKFMRGAEGVKADADACEILMTVDERL